MLKYVVPLFLITFCDAHPNRIVGKYDQIVLAQNPPLVSFFMEHKSWPNESTSMPQSGLDENDCASLFRQKTWIMHSLWPRKISGGSPAFCRKGADAKQIMKYRSDEMDPIFKNLLKTTWPDIAASRSSKSVWNTAWTKHGTCLSDNENMNTVTKFFEKTVEVLNEHNIGILLERSNIIPGNNYTLNTIIDSLKRILNRNFFIKCLQIKDLEVQEQYLLEVQICFNKRFNLIDCHRCGSSNCAINKPIIYPTINED